ncbi:MULTISPECIES: hypothetical protein [Streptomyces]|uniref:hypothetical protein n=1 Tax=Streptomyces TaxID=1883 RepID=UPI001D131E29|nr:MULTISPECIES: hypothetical protein [Streptomyces]
MGDNLLPWAVALLVASVLLWLFYQRPWERGSAEQQPDGRGAVAHPAVLMRVVAVVLALVVGTGAVVETDRIGDSGAQSVWEGV